MFPFSFWLVFRPKVFGENGDRKRNFSKTLSIFVWMVKTELFESDEVTAFDLDRAR